MPSTIRSLLRSEPVSPPFACVAKEQTSHVPCRHSTTELQSPVFPFHRLSCAKGGGLDLSLP